MFCPRCAKPLSQVPNPDAIRFVKEIGLWLKDPSRTPPESSSESEYWVCSDKNCVFGDSPLIKHHPYHGMDSAPGDSWSLSWFK